MKDGKHDTICLFQMKILKYKSSNIYFLDVYQCNKASDQRQDQTTIVSTAKMKVSLKHALHLISGMQICHFPVPESASCHLLLKDKSRLLCILPDLSCKQGSVLWLQAAFHDVWGCCTNCKQKKLSSWIPFKVAVLMLVVTSHGSEHLSIKLQKHLVCIVTYCWWQIWWFSCNSSFVGNF